MNMADFVLAISVKIIQLRNYTRRIFINLEGIDVQNNAIALNMIKII